jgi:NitT/TauT family transport system substrate-binding protein
MSSLAPSLASRLTLAARITRITRIALVGAIAIATTINPALAADPPKPPVKLRGTLDFIRYGSSAPSDHAVAKGYFAQYGLDVRFDASRGSQDALVRIASGAYDVGTADIPTLIQFVAQNPAQAPRAVLLVLDRSPLAVTTLRKNGITRPADLVGRNVAIGTTDGGSRLFPAMLRLNGVDPDRINSKVVDVRVRDSLFLRGDVDAFVGNDYTVLFNMKGM